MRKVCKCLVLVLAATGILAVALRIPAWRDQPLTISFVGFTNVYQFDRPVAMFVATNKNSRPLRYATYIECKTGGTWPLYVGPLPHNDSPFTTIAAGREFTILKLPPTGDVPWRISVAYGIEETSLGRARWRVAEFFYDRNLDKVGQLIHEGGRGYIAVGPEITHDQAP